MRDPNLPNILFVDDEQDNLTVFSSTFRRYYNVFEASSGAEALDIIRHNEIMLVLSDQRMPQMTGVELFESIADEHPDPIRILITGYSDANDIIKAINVGHIFRYITKPWDEAELKQSMDVAIKIYKLERRNRDYIKRMHEESIKRDRLLSLFTKFVPEHIVRDVLKDVSTPNLFKGEERKVGVLYIGIKNWHQLIQKANSKEVIEYLNRYLDLISGIVEKRKGFIDKFIDNKIIALFGVPLSDINIEKNALYSALDIVNKLKKFNQEYSEKIGFKTEVTMGINSGLAVVGNIGSEQHISYTVIGDTVNTASRIYDLGFELNHQILISEPIYQALKNSINLKTLGPKTIKGKDEKVNLYLIEEETI